MWWANQLDSYLLPLVFRCVPFCSVSISSMCSSQFDRLFCHSLSTALRCIHKRNTYARHTCACILYIRSYRHAYIHRFLYVWFSNDKMKKGCGVRACISSELGHHISHATFFELPPNSHKLNHCDHKRSYAISFQSEKVVCLFHSTNLTIARTHIFYVL